MSKWTRHGECSHCGHCCEVIARQPLVRNLAAVDDPSFYRVRGFVGEPAVLWTWLLAPCPQHQGGTCAVYETRPATCASFPQHPRDIVGSPCSYWFSRGAEMAGGLGSPAPVSVATWLEMEAPCETA